MLSAAFSCCFSDSDQSEEGLHIELQHDLMDKVGLVEGALSELAHDHQLTIAVGNLYCMLP